MIGFTTHDVNYSVTKRAEIRTSIQEDRDLVLAELAERGITDISPWFCNAPKFVESSRVSHATKPVRESKATTYRKNDMRLHPERLASHYKIAIARYYRPSAPANSSQADFVVYYDPRGSSS